MKKRFITSMLTLMAGTVIGAYGQTEGTTPSGTCGDCTWKVEHETLTIQPIEGTYGTLKAWDNKAPWSDYSEGIRRIKIENTVKPATVKNMFAGMKNLIYMDISGLDLTNITNNDTEGTNSGMFTGTKCPYVMVLPKPKSTDDFEFRIPDFADTDNDALQRVGNGDLTNPNGAIFHSLTEMKNEWKNATSETLDNWGGTYVRTRKLVESKYKTNTTTGLGTLCYPLDVQLVDNNEWIANAYKVTSASDGQSYTLVLTKLGLSDLTSGQNLPPNTPVMLYKKGGATISLPGSDKVYYSLAPHEIKCTDGNMLVGCYGYSILFGDPNNYNEDNSTQYVYQTNSKTQKTAFYRINPNTPVHTVPFRCYLELPEAAASNRLNAPKFDFSIPSGDTTGITSAVSDTADSPQQGVFDLQGHRVSDMVPGNIYIVNGIKVLVR